MADSDDDVESIQTSQLSIYSLTSTVSLASQMTITDSIHDENTLNTENLPSYASVIAADTFNGPAHFYDNSATLGIENPGHESSSTGSLGTLHSYDSGKRLLLLVFVHGFWGSEVSFESFPCHVCSLVADFTANTHTVQTKLYPRHQSHISLAAATHDLSQWLRSLEGPNTDVILLNHSMGGILAAEVALLPSPKSSSSITTSRVSPLKHRILGSVNLDTPFLGVHPVVINGGLGTLLRNTTALSPKALYPRIDATSPHIQQSFSISTKMNALPSSHPTISSTNHSSVTSDSSQSVHTNPNEVSNLVTRYSQNIALATSLVATQIEFVDCLFNYESLKIRYSKIRMLEETEKEKRSKAYQHAEAVPRVRFANYYTACAGERTSMKEQGFVAPLVAERQQNEGSYDGNPLLSNHSSPVNTTTTDAQVTRSRELAVDVDEDGSDNIMNLSFSELKDCDNPIHEVELESCSETQSDFQANYQLSAAPASSTLSSHEQPVSSFNNFSDDSLENFDNLKLSAFSQPPVRPDVSLYGANKNAFKEAFELYRTQLRELSATLKAQHESEVDRLTKAHKHRTKERKENINRLVRQFKEEQKIITDTSKADRKVMAETQSRDKSKEAQHADKGYTRSVRCLEKEQRKRFIRTIKEEGKRMNENAKAERESLLNIAKEHRRRINWAAGLERKASDEIRHSERSDSRSSSKFLAKSPSRQSFYGDSSSNSSAAVTALTQPSEAESSSTSSENKKSTGERTFCTLPPRYSSNTRDPTWRRIEMRGVNEMGAHCSLFFPEAAIKTSSSPSHQQACGTHYPAMVEDVAKLIESWVVDSMSERLIDDVANLDIYP